jgi:hypothetical protein
MLMGLGNEKRSGRDQQDYERNELGGFHSILREVECVFTRNAAMAGLRPVA